MKCKKCLIDKPTSEFYKCRYNKSGYRGNCKRCIQLKNSEYLVCGLTHKDYDEKRRSTESYRLKYNEYAREYRKTHKRNPEDAKRYRQSESYKALMSQPRKRVSQSMSIKINKVLKSGKEGRSWQDITGYTVDELMEHLEKQFDDKMTWDNRGSYWHVDHIKPISSFDFVSASDIGFKECWSLKNLRPLEAVENMRKGKSVDWVR